MVIIKRYPNRKLYDTEKKQYITLEGVAEIIREGNEVQVIDHVTGQDLTALTLTQIILDQEKKRSGLLSNSVLTSLIRAGGDRLNSLQKTVLSSVSLWNQIDEDIKRRIQSLIKQGELTKDEGQKLLDKLLNQGIRQRDEQLAMEDISSPVSEKDLETYLAEYQIPSQEDIQRLYSQLEELATKLEESSQTDS